MMERQIVGSFMVYFIVFTFGGCDAGIADIQGLPDCFSVDLSASHEVCYPMTDNINQQQFLCEANPPSHLIPPVQCRQKCSQTDPTTNMTISFYTDCTPEYVTDCSDVSQLAINPGCSQNGLQVGAIVLGCTMDISNALDGIFCNLTRCDMGKSLLDVYDKCSICRWISVYADECYPSDETFACTNVVVDQQTSSKYGCRAIACSTFGTNGIMTLNSSSTIDCWESDWYEQLSR